ncbi:MAG: hypothetical protein AAGI67_11735 [Pseudomonadota bacterium]
MLIWGLAAVGCYRQPVPDLSDLPAAPSQAAEPSPEDSVATPAEEPAAEAPAVQRYQVVDSRMLVKVYRAGRLARLGHNHTIEAPILGSFSLENDRVKAELYVRPGELLVDRPETRAAQGEDFAGAIKPKDVEGTRGNLLSEKVLNPLEHPFIRATIDDSIDADGSVTVTFELAGATATQALGVDRLNDSFCRPAFRGAVTLGHDDFGLTPFSILGGAVAVANDFEVSFTLTGDLEVQDGGVCQD